MVGYRRGLGRTYVTVCTPSLSHLDLPPRAPARLDPDDQAALPGGAHRPAHSPFHVRFKGRLHRTQAAFARASLRLLLVSGWPRLPAPARPDPALHRQPSRHAASTPAGAPGVGGGFLLEPTGSARILTPEMLTDEQRMMKETAEDFMRREVEPRIGRHRGEEARADAGDPAEGRRTWACWATTSPRSTAAWAATRPARA